MFQAPFIEDVILEIDTSSNTLVRAIDLKDILSYELPVIDDAAFEVDGGIENETDFDWFHANSIEYDKDRNEIIISGRHQGMIGVNYDTLKLNWFIPHNPEFYEKESSYPIMRHLLKIICH